MIGFNLFFSLGCSLTGHYAIGPWIADRVADGFIRTVVDNPDEEDRIVAVPGLR